MRGRQRPSGREPAAETKRRYFDAYLKDRTVPEDWVSGSLDSFCWWSQSALAQRYVKQALAALPQMKRERKIFFVLAWLSAFVGRQTGKEALGEVRAFLRDNRLDKDLERKVLEMTDHLARTVRIRRRFGK